MEQQNNELARYFKCDKCDSVGNIVDISKEEVLRLCLPDEHLNSYRRLAMFCSETYGSYMFACGKCWFPICSAGNTSDSLLKFLLLLKTEKEGPKYCTYCENTILSDVFKGSLNMKRYCKSCDSYFLIRSWTWRPGPAFQKASIVAL